MMPGIYLIGSLFLKSGVTLDVPEGTTLIGSEKLEDYPMLPTRIAGIEMTWPGALINVRDQHNVVITGEGTIDGVAILIHVTRNWNPTFSYATLPAGIKDMPPYWVNLTTPVPEQQGLPHFSDVLIWNSKAAGAKTVFNVAAYPNATLDDFRFDHLEIQADTAGTSANAKNWTITDSNIQTKDGSKPVFSDSTFKDPKDVPFAEPK
jgi:hypothetical protein